MRSFVKLRPPPLAAAYKTTSMKIYTYSGCSTCKKATKWLDARGIQYEELAIRDTPPTKAELSAMQAHLGDRKKLFNVSGMDYRSMGLKDTLPGLSDEAAIELLANNGNLVKRPFVIGEDFGIVGFKEPAWQAQFE